MLCWICPLFYQFSCQYLLINYIGYCCIFQWVPETLKLNMLWFICTNARWTYEVQSHIDFTFFYLHFFFRIMTNGSLPRDKKPTKENTDNSSMAGFVKSHPEIINIFFVMPQDTKHDLEADSQNLQICYTTCLHCLDLDLSGQKTRRNFWRVQGRAQPDIASGPEVRQILKSPDSGLLVFFLPRLRTL